MCELVAIEQPTVRWLHASSIAVDDDEETDRYLMTNPTITQATKAVTTLPANTNRKRLQLSSQGAILGRASVELPHCERSSSCRVAAIASP
jgi:hypothetical protein